MLSFHRHRTDVFPVGGEANEDEVLERGYDSLSDDDEDGRGLQYACEGNSDVLDGLPKYLTSFKRTALTSHNCIPFPSSLYVAVAVCFLFYNSLGHHLCMFPKYTASAVFFFCRTTCPTYLPSYSVSNYCPQVFSLCARPNSFSK